MMYVNEEECEKAGLDIKVVEGIARRISRAAREAQGLGLTIFGGASGSLRFDDGTGRDLVVSDLDGLYEGGDGACWTDEEGLLRGEGEGGHRK
jgi:hypothetical protein